MDKRQRERLELEGNSVFTDLRMERDTLRQQWDELSALAHDRAHGIERLEREKAALLEALELLADGVSSPDYPNTVTHVPAPWMLTAARAAIAQARGESN